MIILLSIMLALAAGGDPNSARAQEKAAQEALDRLADEMEAQMSPEERRRFHDDVVRSATGEMQAKANRCGTSLVFSEEPRFEDRAVWTAPAATAEQVACVQQTYPFVKRHKP